MPHYLNKKTGQIYSIYNKVFSAIEDGTEDELPDWEKGLLPIAKEIIESDDYIELWRKEYVNDYEIMRDFCY